MASGRLECHGNSTTKSFGDTCPRVVVVVGRTRVQAPEAFHCHMLSNVRKLEAQLQS